MYIRSLDMDDWMVLYLMGRGYSVTETAKILCITQPAATQRVRKMEMIFGYKLFKRKGISLEPIPRADHIFVFARQLLESVARTFPDAAGYARGDTLVHYVLGSGSDWTTGKPDESQASGPTRTDDLDSPVSNDASQTMVLPHPQPDVMTSEVV